MTWIAENRWPDPGPPPEWWREDAAEESWRLHCARREMVARRGGSGRGTSAAAVNALFDPSRGYDPQELAPRRAAEIERLMIEAVAVPAARPNRP